jgi:hypothetical protein
MIECMLLLLTVWSRLSLVLVVYCLFCLIQAIFLNGNQNINLSLGGFLAGIICLLIIPIFKENLEKASN